MVGTHVAHEFIERLAYATWDGTLMGYIYVCRFFSTEYVNHVHFSRKSCTEFAPRTGSYTLSECLTSSDTYFNRRDRRSKGKEGWLFAGDQNLIFIQSGGKSTAPEGVTFTSTIACFSFPCQSYICFFERPNRKICDVNICDRFDPARIKRTYF